MTIQSAVLRNAKRIPLCLFLGVGFLVPGCQTDSAANAFSSGSSGGTTAATSTTKSAAGGAVFAGGSSANLPPCVPAATGPRTHETGNYDNRSCNSTDCHIDMLGGGWIYASVLGVPWIGGATITITNSDGTTVTAVSGEDGFFEITQAVRAPYQVCASKCPGVACSTTPHPNADCQTSNCHGIPTQRIYVPQNTGGASGSGGASAGGGGTQNCAAPVSGGPYTHTEFGYGNQPCSRGGCHSAPKQVFKGGFLYDGPTGTKTIAQASITLTPTSGPAVTAIAGPDGMFFFGTVSSTSTAKTITAPYTACVSKCPLHVCSAKDSHTTTDDCQTSNCHNSDNKVYLK